VHVLLKQQNSTCLSLSHSTLTDKNKNSIGDKIANVNFYAVHPEATRIRRSNAK